MVSPVWHSGWEQVLKGIDGCITVYIDCMMISRYKEMHRSLTVAGVFLLLIFFDSFVAENTAAFVNYATFYAGTAQFMCHQGSRYAGTYNDNIC